MTAAALVLAALGGVSSARAEDAASLLREGVELRRQGKDREALARFERAAALESSPHVLGQLALAEQSLGLWVQAEVHLKAALDGKPGDSDPWVRKNQKVLKDCWSTIEDHLASFEVWGSPAGAEVVVDGQVIGTLPFERPARVVVGEVAFQVRAPGHVEAKGTAHLTKDAFVRTHVELSPVPVAPPPPALADTSVAAPGLAVGGGPAPTRADESPPIYKRWWFWATAGALVAGAVVTTYALTRGTSDTTCMPAPGVTCVTW